MERTKIVRSLRIAVSAVCGVLCVLLIALWARSHDHRDMITYGSTGGPGFMCESVFGWISTLYFPLGTGYLRKSWDAWSIDPDGSIQSKFNLMDFGMVRFQFIPQGMFIVAIPHWFLVLLAAAFAAAPWLRWSWRFSLRTLLIVTTIVAVALGTVLWMRR